MARLTRQQQEEFDALRQERDVARALSWPNTPPPKPLERPQAGGAGNKVIHGWTFNVFTREIREQWQTFGCSYDNAELKNGSRMCEPLYATKREAWLALYHACCWQAGKTLAGVLAKLERDNGE